ncbi:hypothetical protein [Lysinibacillus sp. S2017]|uniref:hypothetical protein n=1 Tax=Lysinibacillus sp. S2017 TaxID=2561923 RepID=UPI001092ACF3|nr:hypothetical protein [Lysinibacillus sp. S2017]TGN33104.1 hypothetical protein E4L99_15195 [Lysinibacillus sp. S2017]
MNNINELEERIKHIEKKVKHIDRLDRTVYELEQKLNKATDLLIRVVEMNEQIDKNDLDYLLLKLYVNPIKYHEIPLLITKTGSTYKYTGEYPNFYEFHHLITETLSLTDEDKKDFSIEVTENLLKKFMKIEVEGNFILLPVCEKILLTK